MKKSNSNYLPLLPILLFFLGAIGLVRGQESQSQQDQQAGDGSRQIVLEEFTRVRPAKVTTKATVATRNSRPRPAPKVNVRVPRYNRKTPALAAKTKSSTSRSEIGITIWRLRPSVSADSGARLLVMEGGQNAQWTPTRIESDQVLALGDRVRISIESPRVGYLYVVDREQYADGSLGPPFLIFPTLSTRGGNNQVRPGLLIDIPAQDDSPPNYTLRSNRPDYAGERLTLLLLSRPLEDITLGRTALPLSESKVSRWEKLWSGITERFEMDGGAGTAWTAAEQAASKAKSGSRMLTQDEPAPQTIYRVLSKNPGGFVVTVPLKALTGK